MHLGCFLFLVIMTIPSSEYRPSFLLATYLEVDTLAQEEFFVYLVLIVPGGFPKWLYGFTLPSPTCESFLLLYSSPILGIVSPFNFSHFGGGVLVFSLFDLYCLYILNTITLSVL